MPSITIETDNKITAWFDAVGKRAAKLELAPILKKAIAPVIAAEQANIEAGSGTEYPGRDLSGALAGSLKPRTGGGDRPGIISVYVPATPTTEWLARKWENSPRAQHKIFAARVRSLSDLRYRVFYAPWVESGHRVVHRNKAGQLAFNGKYTTPVEFAKHAEEATNAGVTDEVFRRIWDEIL